MSHRIQLVVNFYHLSVVFHVDEVRTNRDCKVSHLRQYSADWSASHTNRLISYQKYLSTYRFASCSRNNPKKFCTIFLILVPCLSNNCMPRPALYYFHKYNDYFHYCCSHRLIKYSIPWKFCINCFLPLLLVCLPKCIQKFW